MPGPTAITAAIDRPVGLRMRQDLICTSRLVRGERRYLLKDPITLAHHQLWPEEFALLQMLDGRTSLAAMKERFEKQFHPSRLDFGLLEILHGQFYRNGFVLSDHLGQGGQLWQRDHRQRFGQLGQRGGNLLAIRLRGINPDPLLDFLDARLGGCFSRRALIAGGLFIMATGLFMLINLPRQGWQLPELAAYLTPANLLWLGLAFLLLKLFHELGHGLACKHFGGECSELGVMLLVFTPCLYCDVSDSWMINDRWKRAFVAAAGMWVELVIAAVCAWLWWFSQPGLLHSLSFHMMLLGSVGTILFNANPLLRYDGYFVLSDLLDAPNLWQQARTAFWNSVRRFFFQNAATESARVPERARPLLWFYGVASLIYRGLITLLILIFVCGLLRLMRLELLGWLLLPWLCGLTVMQPLRELNRFLKRPRRSRRLRRWPSAFALGLLLSGLAAVGWWPLPASIQVPVLVRIANSQSVLAGIDGRLLSCLPEGSRVTAGQIVAQLESPTLQLDCLARRGDLARQRARLTGLEARRTIDPSVSSLIPTVREAIAGLELEVARLELALDQLVLRAPVAGKVIAPVSRQSSSDTAGVDFWLGTPLQPENWGCHVLRGTQICDVGDPRMVDATAYLTQTQIELIQPGQTVQVKTFQHPHLRIEGQVIEVGSTAQTSLPAEVMRSNWLPTRRNEFGIAQEAEPLYAARIKLESVPYEVLSQMGGWARIRTEPMTTGKRLLRFFHQTFSW